MKYCYDNNNIKLNESFLTLFPIKSITTLTLTFPATMIILRRSMTLSGYYFEFVMMKSDVYQWLMTSMEDVIARAS